MRSFTGYAGTERIVGLVFVWASLANNCPQRQCVSLWCSWVSALPLTAIISEKIICYRCRCSLTIHSHTPLTISSATEEGRRFSYKSWWRLLATVEQHVKKMPLEAAKLAMIVKHNRVTIEVRVWSGHVPFKHSRKHPETSGYQQYLTEEHKMS